MDTGKGNAVLMGKDNTEGYRVLAVNHVVSKGKGSFEVEGCVEIIRRWGPASPPSPRLVRKMVKDVAEAIPYKPLPERAAVALGLRAHSLVEER